MRIGRHKKRKIAGIKRRRVEVITATGPGRIKYILPTPKIGLWRRFWDWFRR